MENIKIEDLLFSTQNILRNYEEDINVLEETNIFKILDIDKKEIKHSKFISYLLVKIKDERLKEKFIQHFFEEVLNEPFNKNNRYEIIPEYVIKRGVSKRKRPDFLLKDLTNKNYFCIEMKIDAKDGINQLKNYNNHLENIKNINFKLYYLTLNGRKASLISSGQTIKYEQISLKIHIVNWLKKCIKEVSNLPKLNSIITQYLEIIELGLEGEKKMEILDLLKREGNLKIAKEIYDNFENAKNTIMTDFLSELKEMVVEKYGFSHNYNSEFIYDEGVYFYRKIKNLKHCVILGIRRENEKWVLILAFEDDKGDDTIFNKIIKNNKIIKEKLNEFLDDDEKLDTYIYWELSDMDNVYYMNKQEKENLLGILIQKFDTHYREIDEKLCFIE